MQFAFGPEAGGSQDFDSIDSLSAYIDAEQAAWKNDKRYQSIISEERSVYQNERNIDVVANWSRLKHSIATWKGQGGGSLQSLADVVSKSTFSFPVVARSSKAAQIFFELYGEIGLTKAAVGVRYLALRDGAVVFGNPTVEALSGAIAAHLRANGLDSKSVGTTKDRLQRPEVDMRRRASDLQVGFDRQQSDWLQKSVEATHMMDEQRKGFATLLNDAEVDILRDREEWSSEWQRHRDHYVEQLKLRAAVSQWAGRAETFEAAFETRRTWTVGARIVGLLVAALWAWGALALAKWLFSDAFVQGTLKAKEGFLRPTWSHELIFAASATVLYLTLFLWMMRILVRMMMSEHHLGVDARSRESMAHTYLALLEDNGAASAEDRAIVLAALFRPITDGLVKDDALPLISPAALLSGSLAGKS